MFDGRHLPGTVSETKTICSKTTDKSKMYICPLKYSCPRTTQVDELVDFMIENFNRSYHTNKAPFGFYVHAAWFNVDESHFPAYIKFIDYLQTLKDVHLVSKFILNSQWPKFTVVNFFIHVLGWGSRPAEMGTKSDTLIENARFGDN